jgi:hypothetical protein
MTMNTDDSLLHGNKDPLNLKQPALPNNALPNAGFWNAPKPEGSKAFADPSKGTWPFVESQPPVLAELTEGFNPPSEPTTGGLVLPESGPLHPEENKAIHLNRMVQGVPLAHQRANRYAAKRGEA